MKVILTQSMEPYISIYIQKLIVKNADVNVLIIICINSKTIIVPIKPVPGMKMHALAFYDFFNEDLLKKICKK